MIIVDFQSGERVELLDSRISTRVRPAIIRNIIGNRLQVFVDKKSSGRSKAGEEEEDSQVSMLIPAIVIYPYQRR